MHRARAELNAQSDLNEHPTNMRYKPQARHSGSPYCRDAACAIHILILILPFSLYGNLPSHNNAYAFFGHTGPNDDGRFARDYAFEQ
jgi:hypothetical protein